MSAPLTAGWPRPMQPDEEAFIRQCVLSLAESNAERMTTTVNNVQCIFATLDAERTARQAAESRATTAEAAAKNWKSISVLHNSLRADAEKDLREAEEKLAMKADMFWDEHGDPWERPEDYADSSGEYTLVFEMTRAHRLPSQWYVARYDDEAGWQIRGHDTEAQALAALKAAPDAD